MVGFPDIFVLARLSPRDHGDGKDGPTERMLPWRLEGDAITFTVPEVDAYAVAVFDTRRDPAR